MYTFLLMLVMPGLLVFHTAQVKAVNPDQDGDVLEEAMADGFLINTEATTLPVKNQSQDNYKAASTPNTGPLQQSSSLTSQEDTTDKTEYAIMESSGMFPSIPDMEKKASRHFPFHATAHNPGRILSASALPFPEEEAGSAVEPERTTLSELIIPVTLVRKDGGRMLAIEPETQEPAQVRNSVNPTTASLAEDGTPGWLIIVSFCLTVGAILCVLVGIATKDKWYKPRSRSLDITSGGNTEEYGKTVTLPLVDKEQEMVTLMSAEKTQKNDGDLTVISLEEPPEKEYLM